MFALVLTGCGADGGADDGAESREAAGGSERPAGLMLAQHDMKGPLKGYDVQRLSRDDKRTSGGLKTDAERCEPLVDVLEDVSPAGARASEWRAVVAPASKRQEEGKASQVGLSAYGDSADAEQAVDRIESAVADCADGFEVRGRTSDDDRAFARVEARKDPGVGDRSVAYALRDEADDDEETPEEMRVESPTLFTCVRAGSSVAVFLTRNQFDPEQAQFPDGLIDTQVEKLVTDGS